MICYKSHVDRVSLKNAVPTEPYGNPTGSLRNCGLLAHRKIKLIANGTTKLSQSAPGAILPPSTSVSLRRPYGFPTEMAGHQLQNFGAAGQAAWDDLDGLDLLAWPAGWLAWPANSLRSPYTGPPTNSLRSPYGIPTGSLRNTKVLVNLSAVD